MSHSSTGQFIRGGQTTQHWYRMAMQVLRYAILVTLTAFTVILGVWCFMKYDHTKFVQSRFWVLARINADYRDKPDIPLRVPLPNGIILNMTSEEIYRSDTFKDAYYELERHSINGMIYATQGGLIFGILSLCIFAAAGRKLGHDERLRGAQLVSVKELKAYVESKWRDLNTRDKELAKQPRYEMGGIEFPPDSLQAQTGIFGTTGSGKTTLIRDLIASIRVSGGHAIIYDRTGDYAASFYDKDCDFIINPFDSRSHCWSPFFDADTPESFAQLFEVLIPTRAGDKDPFWPKSARIVAEFVSRELVKKGHATNAHLRDALMNLPIDKLAELVQGTPGDKFVGEDAGKMGSSVYATLLSELRFLEFLRDDGPSFSARRWVKSNLGHTKPASETASGGTGLQKVAPEFRGGEKGSLVFLTGHPEMDAATRNITSAIMELTANALMGGPEAFAPQLFFIIDELPALNRLPFLTGKLAEVRKVGGCFVVGFQVLSQLEDIYGKEGATTILGNLNNTFFGSTPDEATADRFSKALGLVDQIESRENISVGANENRDGVGFMKNRFERRIVTATQVMKLPQFQTYGTFAYDSPSALIKFKRTSAPKVAEPLLPYTGAGFGTGSLDPEKYAQKAAFKKAPAHKHAVEFSAWLRGYQDHHLGEDSPQPTDADKRALWSYYAGERLKGISKDLIGPPTVGREYAASVQDAATGNLRSPHAYNLDDYTMDAFDQSKPGLRVVVAGSSVWENKSQVWDELDKAFHAENGMVLCHKGMIGADTIAAKWAADRWVPQIVFGPKFDLYGEDAPDRSDEAMFGTAVCAVLIFGTQRDGREVRQQARFHRAPQVQEFLPVTRATKLPDYPLSDSPVMSRKTPAETSSADTAPSTDPRRTGLGRAPTLDCAKDKRAKSKQRPAGPNKLPVQRSRLIEDKKLRARDAQASARTMELKPDVRARVSAYRVRGQGAQDKTQPTAASRWVW